MSKSPLFRGQPIGRGWWWLQFSDGPGPRFWDGHFWDRGSVFVTVEDYADNPVIGPCIPPASTIADAVTALVATTGQSEADAINMVERLRQAGWELYPSTDLAEVHSSDDSAEYWNRAIGGVYQPVKWNPRHAHHPVRVKEVIGQLKAGEACQGAADVIVGLIHTQAVAWNLCDDLIKQIAALEDQKAALERRAQPKHPWYGECDRLGPGGACAGCLHMERIEKTYGRSNKE